MIISHKHQFIFVHSRKAAGSSITASCNPFLGPRDIQTGIWPDSIKYGGRFNRKAICILLAASPQVLASSMKWTLKNRRPTSSFTLERANSVIKSFYKKHAGFTPDPNHPTAAQVKKYDERAWRDYFKFTVVRNPWDQAVSHYYWKLKEKKAARVGFKEFLKRMDDCARPDPEDMRPPLATNWELYSIADQVVVDHVARFEELENELRFISEKLGIPLDAAIRSKGNVRDKTRTLSDHYDIESVDLVARIYRKEIEQFNYDIPFSVPGR